MTRAPYEENQDSSPKKDNTDVQVLLERIDELEQENSKLKSEFVEMKNAVVNTSAVIEENNKKIIEDY